MVKIVENPENATFCNRCKCKLSYEWKDAKKRDVIGSMCFPPYTIFYIICPNCKNHVTVYKTVF